MAKARQSNVISEAEAEEYELLNPLLRSLLTEMKELSKKKQDGVVNKLKVTIVNKILERIRGLLEKEPTSRFIALLDDETLPTNSDVVLILAQFKAAMDQYHSEYYWYDQIDHQERWHTKENP